MSNTYTVVGHLGADPELRYTPQGKAVVSLTVADTPRNLDRASGQWVDGETNWVKVTAWDTLAENVAKSLKKGHKVIVIGEEKAERYKDKATGEDRTSKKIVAREIAPSLTGAVVTVEKVQRSLDSNSNAPTNNASVEASDDTPF